MSEGTDKNMATMEELQYYEKALKVSEEYRQEARTKKDIWEKQVKEKEEELAKLGTTAENARNVIEEINKGIQDRLNSLKNMIPIELLVKKGKIEKRD